MKVVNILKTRMLWRVLGFRWNWAGALLLNRYLEDHGGHFPCWRCHKFEGALEHMLRAWPLVGPVLCLDQVLGSVLVVSQGLPVVSWDNSPESSPSIRVLLKQISWHAIPKRSKMAIISSRLKVDNTFPADTRPEGGRKMLA